MMSCSFSDTVSNFIRRKGIIPVRTALVLISSVALPAMAGSNTDLLHLTGTPSDISPAFTSTSTTYTGTTHQPWADLTPLAKDPEAVMEVRVNGGAYSRIAPGTPLAAAQNYILALKQDTGVVQWGNNNSEGNVVPPAGLTGVVSVASGYAFNLALMKNGTVRRWGYPGFTFPEGIASVTNAAAVFSGEYHAYVVKNDGSLQAWSQFPLPAGGVPNVISICQNIQAAVAAKADGSVVAWNASGFQPSLVPAGLSGVRMVVCTYSRFAALKTDGSVQIWPEDPIDPIPFPKVSGLKDIVSISAAHECFLALGRDGKVTAIGHGAVTRIPAGLQGVTAIASQGQYGVALKNDGTLVTWGNVLPDNLPPPSSNFFATWTPNVSVPLSDGTNVVELRLTPPGGSPTKTYTLNLDRTPNASLLLLEPDRGALTPAFSPEITSYSLSLPFASEGIRFRPVTQATGTTVTWNGTPIPPDVLSNSLPLNAGTNSFLFRTTASDGITQRDYQVQVTREAPGTNRNLRFLAASTGGLTPAFSPTQLAYTLSAPVQQAGFRVWPKVGAVSAKLEVRINGGAYARLSTGNPATVDAVLKPDGFPFWWDRTDPTKTIQSTEPIVPCGAITSGPGGFFAVRTDGTVLSRHREYAKVPAGLTDVVELTEILPVNGYAGITVALRGAGNVVAWESRTGLPVDLFSDENQLATIAGGRFLAGIRRDGTLALWNPPNDPYPAPYPNPPRTNLVAASAAVPSVLQSDGTAFVWGIFALDPTYTTPGVTGLAPGHAFSYFHIKEDGKPGIPAGHPSSLVFPDSLYDLRMIRTDYGRNLAVRADGEVIPWGDVNTTMAGTGVPAGLKSQALPDSTLLPLNLGNNLVEVRVTAEDGSANIYTISITRLANLDLASVSLNEGEFPVTPAAGVDAWDILVPAGRESITFNATLKDNTESMTLNGSPLASGATTSVALTPGLNTVTLVVQDQDQATSRTYTFRITRSQTGPELLSLATSDGPTVPAFSPAVKQYTRATNRPSVVVWASPVRAGLERRTSPTAAWEKMSSGTLTARGGNFLAWVKPDGTVGINSQGTAQANELSGICSVAGGQTHLTALRKEGTVAVWGTGPGAGLPAGLVAIKAVAAANDFSLALRADGTVLGWGTNSHGQLNIPAGLDDVIAISARGGATPWCIALRKDGTVVTWGAGASGPLPLPPSLTGVVAITGLESSWDTSLQKRAAALLENGRVIFWDVTTGVMDQAYAPLHDIVAISGNLALRRDGGFFDLANSSPVYSSTLTGVATLEGGMAVKQDGSVWLVNGPSLAQAIAGAIVDVRPTWVGLELVTGVNPALTFRVTDGASQDETSVVFTRNPRTDLRFLAADGPALVPAFSRSVRTYSLGSHAGSTLRLRPAPANPNAIVEVRVNNGSWTRTAPAENFEGYDLNTASTPICLQEDGTISGLDVFGGGSYSVSLFGRRAVSVARGETASVVLLEDGTPVSGQPFPVTYPELAVPAGVRKQSAISVGQNHAVSLGEDGRVMAWGNSSEGKLTVPSGLENVVQVRAGQKHSLALKVDGTVAAWGRNTEGQCSVPAGLTDVVAIAAGHTQSMALKRDGTVVVWGTMADGSTNVPAGLTNVMLIAAEGGACVAVRENGTAVRWGDAGRAYDFGATPYQWEGVSGLSSGYGQVLAALPFNQLRTWAGVSYSAGVGQTQELKPQVLPLPLVPGHNTIDVRVSEPDGSLSEITTLTVTRTPNAALTSLHTGSFVLTPAFDPAVDQYTLEVAAGTASLPLQLTTQESGATVTLNGTAVSGGKAVIPLPAGALNPITIIVTAAGGGASRTIQIQPLRAQPSTVATLGLITTGTGPLSPAFDPLVKTYQQDFRFANASLRAVPMGTAARMEVSLNDGPWQNLFHGQRLAMADGASLIIGPGGQVQVLPAPEPGSLYALPPGLTQAVSVAAYKRHLLALKPDGTVVAWGENTQGQSSVPAGLRDVIAIAAGSFHSMALRQDGTVAVWGAGASGVADIPSGLNDVIAISGGNGHCLALRRNGTVVTWGTIPANLAVPAGLNGVTAIAAVNDFSTVLRSDGTPLSWGTALPSWPVTSFPALLDPWGVGVVGFDGLVTPSSPGGGGILIPSDLGPVVSLLGNRAIGLAVRTDGTVRNWGMGFSAPPANTQGDTRPIFLPFPLRHGANTAAVRITAEDGMTQETYQIGINRLPNTDLSTLRLLPGTLTPAYQPALTAYTATVPFYQSSIEITATPADTTSIVSVNGVVSTTGKTVIPLNPGLNTIEVDVAASDNVTTLRRTITVTRQASLATRDLRGLGSNAGGVMNLFAPTLYSYSATPPTGDFTYWPRTSSAGTTLAYRQNNGNWQTLNGTGTPVAAGNSSFVIALRTDGTVAQWSSDTGVPAVPAGMNNIVSLAIGNSHAMALNSVGRVIVWGSGSSTLQPPASLAETAAIASGRNHCLALGLTGTVTAWGNSSNGQTTVPSTLPPAMAVAAGSNHSLALSRDGRVFSWGSMAQTTVPAALPPVVGLAAGDNFSVALKNDGTVVAWGDNTYGQRNVPATLSRVVQIACGGRHVLALRADGTVAAWGDNSSAQTTVPAGLGGVVAVNAGGSFSLAVRRDGRLVVWGISSSGQRNIPANLVMPALDSAATLAPLPGQTLTEFRVSSLDGLDTRTYTVQSSATLASAYAAWATSNFPTGTASALTTTTVDFDRDGQANLMEYITGNSPTRSSSDPLGLSMVDGMLEITWPRRAGLTDGFELLEGAPALHGPWTSIPLDGIIRTPGIPGSSDRITLRQAPSSTRFFIRLRVTLP
jgi:alpha-tubulin suppressor-like RCC1 family protein